MPCDTQTGPIPAVVVVESVNDGDYFIYINVTDQNIVTGSTRIR